ncbi:synaptonemal complex protein 2 isoform X1 [Ricinus communis]|uniref:synaptonemal complex protein 2 isoform X1 n=2 Tax=Ricinus communis TaxID=3988 RepID=UPI00201AEA1C|nr:synaptonemal complex protein 2 isoform X1 [Ricinus communis]XP_048226521.1 synaptonemal complex protein 2 isoform X1 [Ricinus communis]
MQKLGFPSLKSFDQYKSLTGSVPGSAKNLPLSSRPFSDSISHGSFTNLKLTAEKLIKEQASVKTDLEIANSKLKKSTEHITALEEKLQNAFNENAKLKVRQMEDEKLWKGLESKFCSTKTLCDQLTETLQHLACQVQDAEKDKAFFEIKLSESSNAIDSLNQQLNNLSLKLGSAEGTVRTREKELEDLKIEKEEKNKIYMEEQCRTANLIEEKDAMLKKFEATLAANRLDTESLNSKLDEMHHELGIKEDNIKCLMTTQEKLEKEKSDLQFSSNNFADKLAMSLQEIKDLEGFVHILAAQMAELDKQNLVFNDKFDQLNSLCDTCFKLIQLERDLIAKHAQKKFNQLHDKFLCVASEKDALQLVNQELNDKIIELQKAQDSIREQLSEGCRLAADRIQKLESEAEMLLSKKNETEILVSKLEETIDSLREHLSTSENKMQDLLSKVAELEMENKDIAKKLQIELRKKAEDLATWKNKSEKHEKHVDSLEKQVTQLHSNLEEKEEHLLQYKNREKMLEDQITESQALLTAAESKLTEAKKQYDMMLESKQMELSKHLKEISQRNDQAINDIRKKYEVEKLEIVNMEKEKADRAAVELERKYNQNLAECKEEMRQQLLCIQDEHAALVLRIQQEHDRKEMSLKAGHMEEIKRAQLQAENELREKTTQLRNEHEVQMKALRCQHEDESRRLQEELDLQKSKEDRQRALLQLQWKVMSDRPQEDQEVTSKKDYSVSSTKIRDPGGGIRSQHAPDFSLPGETQTPVSKILKRVDNANTGSVMSIPKHHKKVTHREYEVETTNGRTVTKRRKTKSTVMFEDPRKHKKKNTPKSITPRSVAKGTKIRGRSHPSNIGDLFSEGSLNPYADDPYAFD